MKEVDSLPVYEGTDKCALDEYSKKMAEKIPKIIENNKYNDADIKKDISEIKSDISELQTSQTNQDEYLEDIYNVLPTETQKGENINIKGTAGIKFKEFSVEGNSKQDSRDGKNLYNPEAINRTGATDEEGWITLNYNNTSSAAVYLNAHHSLSDNIKPLTNYYLILEIKEVSGNASLVVSQYLSNSKSQIYTNLSENLEGLVAGQKKKYSVYSIENLDEAVYMLRTFLSVPAGENAKIVYRLSLIEQDVDIDNFEYEPYGVSPSPDYPSEIQNVEGNVNVTVCDKNIMKINTEDYEFTESGIKNTASSVGKKIAEMKIKKGQTVKFGFLLLSKPTTSSTFTGYFNDIQNVDVSFTNFQSFNLNQKYERTYIATEDVDFKMILWGNSNNEEFEFQLWAELDELTDYEKHQEQVVTFPLSEGQNLYLGDYLASDGIHHVRKQVELDGTDTWFTSTLNEYQWFGKNIVGVRQGSELICNYLKNYKNIGSYIGISNHNTANRFYVAISTEIKTIEQLQTWLAEKKQAGNPFVVEYELAEEEIEPYTEIQQEAYNQLLKLKSYEGSTNVYSPDEVGPIFKVTAVKSLNNVNERINNLESMLTQINNVLIERS